MMTLNSILFVCLGNICRSPLAEGIAKKRLKEAGLECFVDSAGTGAWHTGEPPCDNSIQVAKEYGLDISQQKARQVVPMDFYKFDLVVALDDSNLKDLKALGCTKPVKLGDYGLNGQDIPDPYYFKDLEGFYKVYEMIDYAVEKMIEQYLK